MHNKSLANKIDHTLIKPNCTPKDIERLCEEAATYQFAGVCVPPYYVKEATRILENHLTKVITVIGFPMGYSTTPAKVEEVKRAIDEGADEIDVVINICAIKHNNWSYVRNDIDSMTRAAHLKGKQIKIIIEIGLLTEEELKQVCNICNDIDVNYVKTSTGYHDTEPVTVKDIAFLRSLLKQTVKIKASGGVRTAIDAQNLLEAGASRLGSSASLQIIEL